MSVEAFAELRASEEVYQLLDVREPWEVALARLPEALTIPMPEIVSRTADLAHDKPLVVMCHHGQRSMQVAAWLRQQGFGNAINLAGGIDAWSRVVDMSVPAY